MIIESHEIIRKWQVEYTQKGYMTDGKRANFIVYSPDYKRCVKEVKTYPCKFLYARDITTPEEFQKELKRTKYFREFREKELQDQESHLRSKSYQLKIKTFKIILVSIPLFYLFNLLLWIFQYQLCLMF